MSIQHATNDRGEVECSWCGGVCDQPFPNKQGEVFCSPAHRSSSNRALRRLQEAPEYDPESADDRAALARSILDTLTKAGFRQTHAARALEVIMERPVKSKSGEIPNTIIRVYTTVDVRHPRVRDCPGCRDARSACPFHALSVRGCGKDAIRVCALYLENQQALSEKAAGARGLTKHRRVHRTGKLDAIVERMMGRARDAWRDVCRRPRCRKCGAPTFTAKSGKDVCAAICWEKKR